MYASQSSALLMTGPELEAADKTAKGILANAISDEIARRSKLTGHQGLQETGARTKARRDRQLRVDRIREPIKDREIELD